MRLEEANVSEPLKTCRKVLDEIVKQEVCRPVRIKESKRRPKVA